VSFKEVQAAYDPAIGFTPRRNFRNWNPELNWSPRFSGHRWFRGVQISGEADINLNLDNQVVDRNLQLTPLELEFHSGDSVEFQLFKQTENLDEDFEISDGVILPLGSSYDWLRYQVVYDGAEHRALSGRVEYSFGDFWNGSRRELNLDLTLRPRPGLSVQLSSEFNDVTLPINPWISLSNNIQFDTDSGELGWQLRFRWIQKPGNDVFFIWTQNWLDLESGPRFSALDRRGVAKIVRTFRF